jgi:predicted nucleic acid-binding protein
LEVSLAVPDHFYVEVSGVLRGWELNAVLTAQQASESFERLRPLALRRVAVPPLLEASWAYRSNMTISDALYVVLGRATRRLVPH